MATSAQRKGFGEERRIIKAFGAIGVKAERVPLSGATGYQGNTGDVDVYAIPGHDPLKVEIKARRVATGWKTVEKQLGDQDMLVMKEDRKSPLVVMRWNTLLEMLKALSDGGMVEGKKSGGGNGKPARKEAVQILDDVDGEDWPS